MVGPVYLKDGVNDLVVVFPGFRWRVKCVDSCQRCQVGPWQWGGAGQLTDGHPVAISPQSDAEQLHLKQYISGVGQKCGVPPPFEGAYKGEMQIIIIFLTWNSKHPHGFLEVSEVILNLLEIGIVLLLRERLVFPMTRFAGRLKPVGDLTGSLLNPNMTNQSVPN